MTALHMASGAGQTAVVTLLLDHGADVHAVAEVSDCSTALGVCTLVLWLSSFLSILTLLGRILEHRIPLRGAGWLPSSLHHSYSTP